MGIRHFLKRKHGSVFLFATLVLVLAITQCCIAQDKVKNKKPLSKSIAKQFKHLEKGRQIKSEKHKREISQHNLEKRDAEYEHPYSAPENPPYPSSYSYPPPYGTTTYNYNYGKSDDDCDCDCSGRNLPECTSTSKPKKNPCKCTHAHHPQGCSPGPCTGNHAGKTVSWSCTCNDKPTDPKNCISIVNGIGEDDDGDGGDGKDVGIGKDDGSDMRGSTTMGEMDILSLAKLFGINSKAPNQLGVDILKQNLLGKKDNSQLFASVLSDNQLLGGTNLLGDPSSLLNKGLPGGKSKGNQALNLDLLNSATTQGDENNGIWIDLLNNILNDNLSDNLSDAVNDLVLILLSDNFNDGIPGKSQVLQLDALNSNAVESQSVDKDLLKKALIKRMLENAKQKQVDQ